MQGLEKKHGNPQELCEVGEVESMSKAVSPPITWEPSETLWEPPLSASRGFEDFRKCNKKKLEAGGGKCQSGQSQFL